MQFLSGARELKLTLRPRMTRFITLDNGGKIPQVDQGLHVQFKGLAEPIPTEAFAAKDGKARGILDTRYAARKAGVDEDELTQILINHPQHGVLFGRVGDANHEERGRLLLYPVQEVLGQAGSPQPPEVQEASAAPGCA